MTSSAPRLDAKTRSAGRRAYTRPLFDRLDVVLQEFGRTVLPKSPRGDALRYLANRWTALQRYVEDGHLAIDTIVRGINCASWR